MKSGLAVGLAYAIRLTVKLIFLHKCINTPKLENGRFPVLKILLKLSECCIMSDWEIQGSKISLICNPCQLNAHISVFTDPSPKCS